MKMSGLRLRGTVESFRFVLIKMGAIFVLGMALAIRSQSMAQTQYEHYLPVLILTRPIAFESDRDGNYYHDLYLMQANGTDIFRVNGPDSVLCPTWSPHGSKLLYVSMLSNDIYQINADGSGLTQLTTGPRRENSPMWSPDGQYIVFSGAEGLSGGIYAQRTDQLGETALITSSAHSFWDPRWSADGQHLAFSSDLEGNAEIYVTNVFASSQTIRLAGPLTRLTFDIHWDSFPDWSPDGTHIAFESHRDGDPEIWVMRSDGSEQTQLTHNNVGDGNPVWSPDGSQILFTSERDGNFDVFVMGADGSNPTNLTKSPFWEGCASWLR